MLLFDCTIETRAWVSTGAAGAWHPLKFWTSPLAPAGFVVLNTNWHPQSSFYVKSGTLSFKFLTQALYILVRREKEMCRLKSLSRLTCLNPLYIVRISDFVNLVSFRRSFSCTVFLFFWASLSATAAWMSMPNSKETLSGSISPIFLLLTLKQHCVFFTKFVYHFVQLIRTTKVCFVYFLSVF